MRQRRTASYIAALFVCALIIGVPVGALAGGGSTRGGGAGRRR